MGMLRKQLSRGKKISIQHLSMSQDSASSSQSPQVIICGMNYFYLFGFYITLVDIKMSRELIGPALLYVVMRSNISEGNQGDVP